MKFKYGIRGHDLVTKSNVEELVVQLKKYEIDYIQLVFPKTFENYSYSLDYVNHVKEVLESNNIKIAMLGAYFNPVHSDINVVNKGISNFKSNLDIMNILNAPFVGSETGSFNDSPWIYVPKNRTEEGYQQSKKVFQELVEYAKKVNGNVIIEPAFGHVMYSVSCLKRLVDELNSPNVFVTIDLYNLLDVSNFDKRDEIFLDAMKTFNSKIKIIHLKDGDIVDNKLVQLAPGKGKFNYPYMLNLISKYCPDATLVFEGVKVEDLSFSKEHLKNIEKNI